MGTFLFILFLIFTVKLVGKSLDVNLSSNLFGGLDYIGLGVSIWLELIFSVIVYLVFSFSVIFMILLFQGNQNLENYAIVIWLMSILIGIILGFGLYAYLHFLADVKVGGDKHIPSDVPTDSAVALINFW